jgi:lipid-A-disaccharide synthase
MTSTKKRNSEATDPMKSKKILLVAGEVSGDLHGSHLVEAIHRIHPEVQFWGVGGEDLKKSGMEILYSAHSLSVVGITEVFTKLRSILKALRRLKKSLKQERPDLVILIDFPDFNFRLAKIAHRRGIPILYYISPQVWAWRPKRTQWIARVVKKWSSSFPLRFLSMKSQESMWSG